MHASRSQGALFYSVGRDVGALDAAEAAVRDLVLSSSFELRGAAQSVAGAAALLAGHPALAGDEESLFLASSMQSSCTLLLGIISQMIELHTLERRGAPPLARAPFSPRDALRDVMRTCAFGGAGVGGVEWVNEREAQLPDEAEVRHRSCAKHLLSTWAMLMRRLRTRRGAQGDVSRLSQIVQNLGASPESACHRRSMR